MRGSGIRPWDRALMYVADMDGVTESSKAPATLPPTTMCPTIAQPEHPTRGVTSETQDLYTKHSRISQPR